METRNAQHEIVSVMGPHAGESEDFIFERKTREVADTGRFFWVHRSPNAKPERVKSLCRKAGSEGKRVYCIFIEPSARGGGSLLRKSSWPPAIPRMEAAGSRCPRGSGRPATSAGRDGHGL
jgi:hypothetical protein